MAPRGKYRTYNKGKKLTHKKHASRRGNNANGLIYERLISDGLIMRSRVTGERLRHFIGEKITLNRRIDAKFNEATVGGVVKGLYPHFILVDCGNYDTTISYKDLVLGGKKV